VTSFKVTVAGVCDPGSGAGLTEAGYSSKLPNSGKLETHSSGVISGVRFALQ
jgi:hypothetical protein